ncbi:DNA methyltransferase [bacterium]|nr:DNA methyltransferase [bacterium]
MIEDKNLPLFDSVGYRPDKMLLLSKVRFLEELNRLLEIESPQKIREEILKIKQGILNPKQDSLGLANITSDGDTLKVIRSHLLQEIDQIERAQTEERMKYYIRRMKKSITAVRTGKINDINLNRWKEYDNIITDSLWILDKRDTSGAHLGWYWGNFIPQIPHQMMLRYTKKGDWVLDTFVGSGTTLIECKRLGRNGIGIELNQEVAQKAKELIDKEYNRYKVTTEVITGDSKTINIKEVLEKHKINQVQLLIMHPPYYDIIKFSKDEKDLSNAKNTKEFLKMFGEVVDNATPFLEKGRYFALVIGDKYSKGEWIPLGFYCMQEVLKRRYLLKSIIVKNFEETRGKRNQKELWRYRALVGGFYVFKHEYIMLFKKK